MSTQEQFSLNILAIAMADRYLAWPRIVILTF